MRTDELAKLLSTGLEPVDRRSALRRAAWVLFASVALASVLMGTWLGIRPTLADDYDNPMFWVKFAFAAWLGLGGALLALRLAQPGTTPGRVPWLLAGAVAVLWLLAGAVLMSAEPAIRGALMLGDTWRSCPFNIAALSAPMLAAALWAAHQLAPTQPARAGAAAGLFAGGIAAFIYAFHCPELAAPFLAVWYVIGMGIPTAIGALAGPRVLRW